MVDCLNTFIMILQEVDNWSTLSSDVDEVFASQDVSMIAAKLAGMKQSLVGGAEVLKYFLVILIHRWCFTM